MYVYELGSSGWEKKQQNANDSNSIAEWQSKKIESAAIQKMMLNK